jgi:hypothetical protein
MDKIIVFAHYWDDNGEHINYENIKTLEATSTKELRLKVRGALLAQLDELVERIVGRQFEELLVTKLGQRLSHDDYKRVESVPAGYGIVIRTCWRATHGDEEFASYHVPAGSTLPNGEKIREGELVRLREYGSKEEQIKRFFDSTQEPEGWILLWAVWEVSDD